MADFESWLSERLTLLNVDAEVFGSYICGILDGEEKREEKEEAIEGILSETCSDETLVLDTTADILKRFSSSQNTVQTEELPAEQKQSAIEDKFRSIFGQQNARGVEAAKKNLNKVTASKEDGDRLKESILNQYGQIEVELEEEPQPVKMPALTGGDGVKQVAAAKDKRKGPPVKEDPLLMKNTNAEAVTEAEKVRREKSRQEAEAKKVQDKLNKEKQKQKEVDRKEKEKQRTQKGERRR